MRDLYSEIANALAHAGRENVLATIRRQVKQGKMTRETANDAIKYVERVWPEKKS
jgi:hypothetical protein